MRRLMMCAAVVVLALTASANPYPPDLRLFIDFDAPYGVHRIDPSPYAPFSAHLIIAGFQSHDGIRGISFVLERTFGGFNIGSENLLGGQSLGGPEDPTGWALTGFECVEPDAYEMVRIARADYMYDGVTPGYLKFHPHSVDGRMVVDCDFEAYYWCVCMNGGVHQDPPEGDPDCWGATPVGGMSWGAIKAMYR